MSDGGKGSSPRPFSVTQEEYSRRWDMIFARDLDTDREGTIRINKQGQREVLKEGVWIPVEESTA